MGRINDIKPIPPDGLPTDDENGGGTGGDVPTVEKTWWQKYGMTVIGLGGIILILGTILLVALL